MKINTLKLIIFFLVNVLVAIPVYSKFVLTNKIESIGKLDLLVDDVDQMVYPALNSGRPIISMALRNVNELRNKYHNAIKIEVFKKNDDDLSFVGSFNFIINSKTNTHFFSLPLPEFLKQSETYEFHVYDSFGVLNSKFSYSFTADQILDLPPIQDGLTPDNLDSSVSDSMIETILRNLAINTSSLYTVPSLEKKDNFFTLNIPTINKSTKSNNNSNTQNLLKTTKDLNYKISSLNTRFNRITNQVNFLNNSLRLKLNSDFSNFTGDLLIKGKIKTNNTADKTINLNLDDSIREGGAIIGKVASNTIPVLRFTKPSSCATWTLSLPKDLVKDSIAQNKFKIKLHWSSNNNLGQNAIWQLDYYSYNVGDTLNSSSKSFSQLVSTPKLELALITTEFEIPTQDFKDILVIKLSRKDSNNINPNLVSFEINYPALSLERF